MLTSGQKVRGLKEGLTGKFCSICKVGGGKAGVVSRQAEAVTCVLAQLPRIQTAHQTAAQESKNAAQGCGGNEKRGKGIKTTS